MAIYGNICVYIAIYVTIYCYILYFRCLYWYFGCLDLYLAVWTCIWMTGLVFVRLDLYFGCQPTTPWSMCLPQALFCFWEMTPLGFLNTYVVDLIIFHGFEALLVFLSKSGQSVQMTMPARRASKVSSKRLAVTPEMCFQSLISQASRTLVWMSTWRIEAARMGGPTCD